MTLAPRAHDARCSDDVSGWEHGEAPARSWVEQGLRFVLIRDAWCPAPTPAFLFMALFFR